MPDSSSGVSGTVGSTPRSAGRAGAVEHVHACGAVLERGGRGVGDGVLVGVVAVDCASHREPQLDVGHLVAQLGGLVGLVRRGDEDPRPAVVDDVRHLVGGEAAAHRGVDESGVVRAPAQHEEAGVVLEAEGDVVAWLQSDVAEQVREAVGLLVEFGVGDDLVGVGHDDGRVIRSGRSVMSGVQDGSSGVGAREPSATPVTRGSRQTVKPPSTSRCCPVMNFARCDARKQTASAISAADPNRRMAILARAVERGLVEIARRHQPLGHPVDEHAGPHRVGPNPETALFGGDPSDRASTAAFGIDDSPSRTG